LGSEKSQLAPVSDWNKKISKTGVMKSTRSIAKIERLVARKSAFSGDSGRLRTCGISERTNRGIKFGSGAYKALLNY